MNTETNKAAFEREDMRDTVAEWAGLSTHVFRSVPGSLMNKKVAHLASSQLSVAQKHAEKLLFIAFYTLLWSKNAAKTARFSLVSLVSLVWR